MSIFLEQGEPKTFTQAPEGDTRGFWVHDPLQDKGIDCTVVHPGDMPIQDKERRKKRDSFVGLIPDSHPSGEKERLGETTEGCQTCSEKPPGLP